MQRNHNHTTIVTVEKVIDETPTVRTLVFSDEVMSNVLPGQFAMVWIPGINELPMSVMISDESGKAAFTVRKHGAASTGLFNIKVGEQIGIRGPYGNSFDLKEGKLLLVGGGTGLVPLMRLLTNIKPTDDLTVLIGAKTKTEVFFEDLANKLLETNTHQVIVVTEDGTYGKKGLVTDIMENLCSKTKYDAIQKYGSLRAIRQLPNAWNTPDKHTIKFTPSPTSHCYASTFSWQAYVCSSYMHTLICSGLPHSMPIMIQFIKHKMGALYRLVSRLTR